MSDPRDNLTLAQQLSAYADGELDLAGQLRVLRRLADDPATARAVEHEVRLRAGVARALADVPPPADELARKIAAMSFQMSSPVPPAEADAPAAAPVPAPASGGRAGWLRLPAAVAAAVALLAAGLLVGRYALTPPPALVHRHDSSDPLVPASFVAAATRVHVGCGRSVDHHARDGWPAAAAALEAPARAYLGGRRPYPDLTPIGFHFAGCCPCGRPDRPAVHILYRSAVGHDTISLFVERDAGQLAAEPNACLDCTPPGAAHPVLAWRAQGLVFALVGNAREPVEQARRAMRLPQPV